MTMNKRFNMIGLIDINLPNLERFIKIQESFSLAISRLIFGHSKEYHEQKI